MDQLRALIKSKGINTPPSRTKKPLQDVWDEVKDKDDWEQTVFFDYTHQAKIDELDALLSPLKGTLILAIWTKSIA